MDARSTRSFPPPDAGIDIHSLLQGCYPRLWVWRLKAAMSSRTHAPGVRDPHTGGMSMSGDPTLRAVRALEDEFAEAMGRMYTVGNDLARLRARLDHEVNQQAAAILEEAETKLLRSAAASDRRLIAYAQMAKAVGSNKTLLRSA